MSKKWELASPSGYVQVQIEIHPFPDEHADLVLSELRQIEQTLEHCTDQIANDLEKLKAAESN